MNLIRLKEKHDELFINKTTRENFAIGMGVTAFVASTFFGWYFQWGETEAIAIAIASSIFVYKTILKVFER